MPPTSCRLGAAALLGALLLAGPAAAQMNSQPEATSAIPAFSIDAYMGQWYEIARLDHPFERGLVNVTSTRTKQPDGTIEVINKGLDKASGRVRESKATGRVIEERGRPRIEISYGPGQVHAYDVLDMAADNSYALVGSTDRQALWIFSRSPKLDPSLVEQLKARAISAGFPVDKLQMVEQRG